MTDEPYFMASQWECCKRKTRFRNNRVPVVRRCPLCKRTWYVTFEMAPKASDMTGLTCLKAMWWPRDRKRAS